MVQSRQSRHLSSPSYYEGKRGHLKFRTDKKRAFLLKHFYQAQLMCRTSCRKIPQGSAAFTNRLTLSMKKKNIHDDGRQDKPLLLPGTKQLQAAWGPEEHAFSSSEQQMPCTQDWLPQQWTRGGVFLGALFNALPSLS